MMEEAKNKSAAYDTADSHKDISTILYEQLVLLAEQSRNTNTVEDLYNLTSAMCEIVRCI